ncbi:type II toxin-antitoxin system RelE/ParE family toxin [Halanaerobium congolense]
MLVIGSYLVFYVVFENKKIVEIRRILHGKRKYNFLL